MNLAPLSRLTDWLKGEGTGGQGARPQDPMELLLQEARRAALNNRSDNEITEELQQDLQNSGLTQEEQHALALRAWKEVVGSVTQGFTSVTLVHQNALSRYVNRMGLTLEETNDDGTHTTLMRSAVLRDALDGITPELQLQPGATLPFEMKEGEKLVWVSENVSLFRTVNVEEPDSAIHSHNVPLIQGVYLGPETFPTRGVQREEEWQVDTGILAFTDRALIFQGSIERLRMEHDRIGLHRFPDDDREGFHLDLEGATDNPQHLVMEHSLSAYRLADYLAMNLRNRERSRN